MNGRGPRGRAAGSAAAAGAAERRAAEIAARVRQTGGAEARGSDAPDSHPLPEGIARGRAGTGAGKAALSLRIAATPPGVRAGLARVMRHPLLLALGAEARAEAELVLAEVMNNIVEHACSCPAGEDPALPQGGGGAVVTPAAGQNGAGARDLVRRGRAKEGAERGGAAAGPERRGAGAEAPGQQIPQQIRLRILGIEAEGRAGLAFRLFDPGRPMPGGQLPEGAPVPTDALAEGGFGWFMIRSLVQDLHYSRARGGNLLAFSMKWKQS